MAEAEGEYIFAGGRGGDDTFQGRGVGDAPVIHVDRAHTSAVGRSGVRRSRLYDLRHTRASRAAMAGVDLVTLTAMLGHSRVQMVMRYAHPNWPSPLY
jgi:integrase